jgi:O-antigen ligase
MNTLTSPFVKAFVYILFVYSGMIKWLPFPIDPTFVLGFLACLIIAVSYLSRIPVKNKYVFIILIFLISFFLYCIISTAYSPSQFFWKQKALSIILSIITLVYPVICFKNEKDFDKVDYSFRFLSTTAASIVFLLLITGNLSFITGSRVGVESSNIPDYLAVGELLGIGVIIYLYQSRMIRILLAFFIFVMLVTLGARGPFLFAIVASTIYFSLKKNQRLFNFKSLFILFVLGAMFIVLAQFWSGAELLTDRLSGFSSFSQDESTLERLVAFQFGLNAFVENPVLGLGLGGFGLYGYRVDENVYPHNIFIEIGAELGIVGLILFTTGLIYVFILAKKQIRHPHIQIYFTLFLFVFLNYLKSGGLIDARKLFIMIGILVAYANFIITSTKKRIYEN